MQRTRDWLTQRALWWLDRVSALTYESCNAYGGAMTHRMRYGDLEADRVRLCKKRRWHTDSHAYEWCHSQLMGNPVIERGEHA